MFKKIILILLSTSLCVAEPAQSIPDGGVPAEKTLLWWGIGAGSVIAVIVCAPLLLPADTLLALKSEATVVAAKIAAGATAAKGAVIAAGPVAMKINLGIAGVRIGKKLVYSNPQERLIALLQEEDAASSKAKDELVNCLKNNANSAKNVSLGIPIACEEAAMLFALYQQAKQA